MSASSANLLDLDLTDVIECVGRGEPSVSSATRGVRICIAWAVGHFGVGGGESVHRGRLTQLLQFADDIPVFATTRDRLEELQIERVSFVEDDQWQYWAGGPPCQAVVRWGADGCAARAGRSESGRRRCGSRPKMRCEFNHRLH